MARQITVIPAIERQYLSNTSNALSQKKKVAAYARVSTDNDEQLSSYEAQVDYYTRHIKSNTEWNFIEVYTDEGISATSTKKRDGFNRMIADALAGKIDLIITKSVSRFARNTVDTLTTVRQLKEKGVEVYFEKENIYTLDSKGELLITIMSSLAQEESRSISENVTWGQRKRFADGKVNLPYGQFLGYEKGENGLPQIVEKEAQVIRRIYKMFLEGKTPAGIAKKLTDEGILTPAGKKKWQTSTVLSILQNEKYKGDARLQKSFTVDFLTKKKKVNEGEIPQYYVENSHPAIVSPEIYDLVQIEISNRKKVQGYKTGGNCFSGKIICGECGSFYGSKVWHSTSIYRRVIWQCNHKFINEKKCQTPHINEDNIKKAFIEVFNSLFINKEETLKDYEAIIKAVTDTSKLEKEKDEILREKEIIFKKIQEYVLANSNTTINQEEYNENYNIMEDQYEKIKCKLKAINNKYTECKARHIKTQEFINSLNKNEKLITEFDVELWNSTIEKVIVVSEEQLEFVFRDGSKIIWN